MTSAAGPQIKIFDFSDNISEKMVYFKLMVMEGSFFIWIGTDPQMTNMAVSMPPKYVGYQIISGQFLSGV